MILIREVYLAHWIQQPIPKLQIQIFKDFFHFLQFWFVYIFVILNNNNLNWFKRL